MTNKGLLIAGGIAVIAIYMLMRRRNQSDPQQAANAAIDAMPPSDVIDLVSVKGGIGIAQIQNIPVDQLRVILKNMHLVKISNPSQIT